MGVPPGPVPTDKNNADTPEDLKDKTQEAKEKEAAEAKKRLSRITTQPGDTSLLDAARRARQQHPAPGMPSTTVDGHGQKAKSNAAKPGTPNPNAARPDAAKAHPDAAKPHPDAPKPHPDAPKPHVAKPGDPHSGVAHPSTTRTGDSTVKGAAGDKTYTLQITPPLQVVHAESRLNGHLTSPDGKESLQVKGGQIVDTSGSVIGQIDANGRVQTKTDVNRTDLNSLKNGWQFEGTEDGKSRSFACGNEMSSGRAFIPDASGRPVAYNVQMGMLINRDTGVQYGRLEPPTEDSNGQLSGGYIVRGNPPERLPLASIPNAVIDVQLMGEGDKRSRRVQAASTGDQTSPDGKSTPGHYINIASEVDGHERHRKSVQAREQTDKDQFHPIDSLTGARDDRAQANQRQIAEDERQIHRLRSTLETGYISPDEFTSPKTQAGGARTDAPVQAGTEKQKEGDKSSETRKDVTEETKSKPINPPAMVENPDDPHSVHKVMGAMRMSTGVYDIKEGKLYHKGQTQPCGELLPGYKVKLDGRPDPIALANESRVLMQYKFAGDSSGTEHRIVGLGRSRIGEDNQPIAGGLVEADELVRRAVDTKAQVDKANMDITDNKNIATQAVYGLLGADATILPLSGMSRNLGNQIRLLQNNLDFTFKNGFNSDFSNNRLDTSVRATQDLATGIGATGASAESLAQEAREVDKSTGETTVTAVTTVLSAGAGRVIGGAYKGAAAVVRTLGAGAGIGGFVSAVGRHSDNSTLGDDMRNLGTGMGDGMMPALGGAGEEALRAAKYGRMAWAAYIGTDAFAQHVVLSTDQAVRAGKPVSEALKQSLEPKALVVGMGAQIAGRVGGKVSGAGATMAGATEKGIAQEVIKSASNAYSNAATAAIPDAMEAERDRVAREQGISKDKVTDDMLSVTNMIHFCNQRGMEAAPMGATLGALTHAVGGHSEDTSKKASKTSDSGQEQVTAKPGQHQTQEVSPDQHPVLPEAKLQEQQARRQAEDQILARLHQKLKAGEASPVPHPTTSPQGPPAAITEPGHAVAAGTPSESAPPAVSRQQQPSGVQARIDQAAVRRRINEHVPDADGAPREPLSREPHADLTKRLSESEARKNANETFLRLNEGSVPARATEALQALKAQLKDNKFAVPQGNSPEVSAIENHKATLEGLRNALSGTEPISTNAMIEKLESMKHMEEELQKTLSGKKKYNVCVEQSQQRQKAWDELLTKYKNDETQGEFRQRANAIEQGVSAHGAQYLRNIEEMVAKMPEGNPRQRQLKEQWQRAVKYNQHKELWKNSLDTTGWEGVWQHIEPQQPNLAFTDIPNGFLLRDLHPPAGSPQGAVYPDAPEGNVYMAPHVTKHLMERWKQQVDIEGKGYTPSPSGQAIERGIKGDINQNIETQIAREMERFGPIQDRALQRQLREMVAAEVRSRLEHQSPPDRVRPELLQLRLQAQMQTLHEAVRQSLSKGLNYRPYDPRIDKTPYKGLRAHVELNGWQLTFCPPEPANGKPFPSVMHALDMWDMDKNLEGEHRPAD